MKYLNKFATELAYDKATDLSYPNISYIVDNDKIMWSEDATEKYRSVPLAFIALDDNVTFTNRLQMIYRFNGQNNWTYLSANQSTPALNAGDIIYFTSYSPITPSMSNYNQFTSTGRFVALGNPLSMVYGLDFADVTDVSSTNYLFYRMFRDCTGITDASHISLPATKLGQSCYQEIFRHCTSLTAGPALPALDLADYCYCNMYYECPSLAEAPALPATTLSRACYQYLFYGCTSLTEAPVLPADALANMCYTGMFRACSGLTTAPALPAMTLATSCYKNMFQECSSLTTPPELFAEILTTSCYQSMFQDCTSLTEAPVLPAETLADDCYNGMFQGCSSLNSISCHATDISATQCTYNWVNGVAATGTFTKSYDASWTTGVNGIPDGWTTVDE